MSLPTSPDTSAAPKPWLFWGTLSWTALSLIVWMLVQTLVVLALLYHAGFSLMGGDQAEIQRIGASSLALALSLIVSMPAQLGIVALAVRRKGWTFADYLALQWPSRANLWLGLIVLAIMLPLGDLTSYLAGRPIVPPFMIDAYRSARDAGILPLLAAAIVVAAPVSEELVFRGFMFRGLAASRVGVLGAILIPSLLWAAMHVQYELFHLVQIFIIGCVFGWLRWRSGSTALTVVMHMVINAIAFSQAVYWAEYVVN
jgi:membrane protease YdiL (CAAX protease family)